MKLESNHIMVSVLVFALLAICVSARAQDDVSERRAIMPQKQAALFKKYCYECHDSANEEAGINLEGISFNVGSDIENAELWAKILNAINSGEMPPKDSTQIADADKLSFLDDLSNRMARARKILSDSGGVITLRRLNRREYQNTLESLLGVRPDVSALPDDQATAGFDTGGASLFFSSDQLELYLATARSTLELALRPAANIKSRTIRVEPELEYNKRYAEAAAEMRDQMARSKAYHAQKKKPPSAFGFIDDYQAKRQKVAEWLPTLERYLDSPETKTGVAMIVTIKQGGLTRIKFPTLGSAAAGKYLVRVRAAAYPNTPSRFRYLEFLESLGGKQQVRLGWRKVTGTFGKPQIIEFPVEHLPGVKSSIIVSQRSHQDRGDKNLATIDMKEDGDAMSPGMWVDWAELIGPLKEKDYRALTQGISTRRSATGMKVDFSTKAAERILFKKPKGWSQDRYAKEVISRFATRAFRGEAPNPVFLDRLFKHYAANRAKDENLRQALIGPLSVVLTSPSFLYMVESTGNEESPSLTDSELAVRLSYFLWSAPPDDELLDLARRGKLSQPDVLKAQTNRLLEDKRSERFLRGFVHQWLEMERLDMFQFDGVLFPTFDNAAREHAREEIFHTVGLLIKQKRPLRELLKSDYVVVNDLLADFYELPVRVEGHKFRKVKLPAGSKRGGLIGTAAVLAMGSDGIRSSPVERGAWVLRHLLNDPPPPAPPNVPQLGRLAGKVLDSRSLQRAHQEEPQCAQCHRKIDPIGYAMENFDAAGLWRDKETVPAGRRGRKDRKFEIDTSGKLSSGEAFADFFGLREVVFQHEDQFARGLAESLIEYGLGRTYGFTDHDLTNDIVEHARRSEFEFTEFVHALIQSRAFQTK